jgi:tetratricopeptide (TPR) repeat protein
MHTDTSQPLMPQLRQALDKAEPFALVFHEHPDGAQRLIALVDHINTLSAQCDAAGYDIAAEHVRVVALNSRVKRNARRIIQSLNNSHVSVPGSISAELDVLVQQQQHHWRMRLIRVVLIVVAVVTIAWYVVATTPPSADTTAILNAITAEDYDSAYRLAQQEAATFPQDLESQIWLSVLAEYHGDRTTAAQAWQRAQAINPLDATTVYMRGNNRVLTKQFALATADANQVLSNTVSRPEGLFLQASIAEAQGDVTQAIAFMRQAADAAEAANRSEFAVLIRIRMGGLMQYGIPQQP